MSIIIVKNLGKKYDITHQRNGYIALRDVLTNILKNPFQFAKHKTRQMIGLETKEEFWALKDVNFEVQKGEVIGIIGANGAGKSTLLKILSQITPPTTGEITINGRVGSLLEVGTGFHPELTGRENIMLNGAILGMKKNEIIKKFDAIVEFAGIEKFLDTPVKYYSSGMYVRLAFSVAAHMEPDVLIIDEVLAVGDAEFQKKCLGKMEEVTKKEGRTILFVSHNISAISRLCDKCILLKQGQIIKYGNTKEVMNSYLNNQLNLTAINEFPHRKDCDGQITKITILDHNHQPNVQLPISENFFIEVEFNVYQPISKKLIFLHFFSQGDRIFIASSGDQSGQYQNFEPGKYRSKLNVPSFLFQVGTIFFNTIFNNVEDGKNTIDMIKDLSFEITDINNPKSNIFNGNFHDKISPILDFPTQKIG